MIWQMSYVKHKWYEYSKKKTVGYLTGDVSLWAIMKLTFHFKLTLRDSKLNTGTEMNLQALQM